MRFFGSGIQFRAGLRSWAASIGVFPPHFDCTGNELGFFAVSWIGRRNSSDGVEYKGGILTEIPFDFLF